MDEARYERMERTMEFLLNQPARFDAQQASLVEQIQILARVSGRDPQRIQQADIEIEALRNSALLLHEAQRETQRMFQETERMFQETDRRFARWLESQIHNRNGNQKTE